jgi:hypothetical protein
VPFNPRVRTPERPTILFPSVGPLRVETWIEEGDGGSVHDVHRIRVTNECGVPMSLVVTAKIDKHVADRTYCETATAGTFSPSRRKWMIMRGYNGNDIGVEDEAPLDPLEKKPGAIEVSVTAHSRASSKNAHPGNSPIFLNW